MRHILLCGTIAMVFVNCGNSKDAPDRVSKEEEAAPSAEAKRVLIQDKGSDTLVNVAQAWAEAYAVVKPNVAVAVTGGGSGTGIAAIMNGTADIANASREMKEKEIETARENGIEPVKHIVGYDALSVFVHKDNPLKEATFEQLGEIYKEGGGIEKWSQLGVKVPGCDSDEIVRVSRQNNSGTYDYFKKVDVASDREYKLGSRDMQGSKDIVTIVEKTPCAIGYSGLAYATADVKKLCVKKDDDAPCVEPSIETAKDGSYPIARPLMMYTASNAKKEVKDYMSWIESDTGQCIILKKGYAPVKAVSCD
jgi:phosphate transport system substrate-binding protein